MENSAIFAVGKENYDLEMAARVAQKSVLKEIYLVDAKISRDPLGSSAKALSLEHKCSTKRSNILRLPIEDILCNFQVSAFSGKSPNKLVMKIEATFCTSFYQTWGIFPIDEEDSEETFRVWRIYFYLVNPISTAWPYWREFVQSMSARMGFPALTVPLLEIVPEKPAAKEVKSQPVKKESTRRKKLSA